MLSNPTVEEFLLEVQRRGSDNGATNTLTTGDIVKDNEQVRLNQTHFSTVFYSGLFSQVENCSTEDFLPNV